MTILQLDPFCKQLKVATTRQKILWRHGVWRGGPYCSSPNAPGVRWGTVETIFEWGCSLPSASTAFSAARQCAREIARRSPWRRKTDASRAGTVLLAWLLRVHECLVQDVCQVCPKEVAHPSKESIHADNASRVSHADRSSGHNGTSTMTADGKKYMLVAVDSFTRWIEAYGIPNKEATTVGKKLVDEVFCRFSPPEQPHSDQGRQFESELIQELCKLLEVHKTHTTPYHPQCNGVVEHFNRTLLDMLSTTVGDHPSDRDLRKLCLGYNSSAHSSTGFTSFFLMFGWQVRLPVDHVQHHLASFPRYPNVCEVTAAHLERSTRGKCQIGHCRQKMLYDRRVQGKIYRRPTT